MKLDANGLPLPGRELDAWIWRKLGLSQYGDYSTTHAFFQVMEANPDWRFQFKEHRRALICYLFRDEQHQIDWEILPDEPTSKPIWVCLKRADYPDRERAYAHAVCAAAWKAEKGGDSVEDND